MPVKFNPGSKNGTKVVLERAGSQPTPEQPARDVAVVLSIIPHPVFERGKESESYDLFIKDSIHLSLKQALCGCSVEVPSINGDGITVVLHDVTKPGRTKRLVGHGLAIEQLNGAEKGDLIVKFDVDFPDNMDLKTKETLESVLP